MCKENDKSNEVNVGNVIKNETTESVGRVTDIEYLEDGSRIKKINYKRTGKVKVLKFNSKGTLTDELVNGELRMYSICDDQGNVERRCYNNAPYGNIEDIFNKDGKIETRINKRYGTLTNLYNDKGLIIGTKTLMDDGEVKTTSTTYDDKDREISFINSKGEETITEYDDVLKTVTERFRDYIKIQVYNQDEKHICTIENNKPTLSIKYNLDGTQDKRIFANGRVMKYYYDIVTGKRSRRVSSITIGNETKFRITDYVYDEEGRKIKETLTIRTELVNFKII